MAEPTALTMRWPSIAALLLRWLQWYYAYPCDARGYQTVTIAPSTFNDTVVGSFRGPGVLSYFGGTKAQCRVDRGFGEESLSFECGAHPVAVPNGARILGAEAEGRGFFVSWGCVEAPIVASEPQQLLLADCGFTVA